MHKPDDKRSSSSSAVGYPLLVDRSLANLELANRTRTAVRQNANNFIRIVTPGKTTVSDDALDPMVAIRVVEMNEDWPPAAIRSDVIPANESQEAIRQWIEYQLFIHRELLELHAIRTKDEDASRRAKWLDDCTDVARDAYQLIDSIKANRTAANATERPTSDAVTIWECVSFLEQYLAAIDGSIKLTSTASVCGDGGPSESKRLSLRRKEVRASLLVRMKSGHEFTTMRGEANLINKDSRTGCTSHATVARAVDGDADLRDWARKKRPRNRPERTSIHTPNETWRDTSVLEPDEEAELMESVAIKKQIRKSYPSYDDETIERTFQAVDEGDVRLDELMEYSETDSGG